MASLYSLFGKTQSQRIQDEDVSQAVAMADRLVAKSANRMAPIENSLEAAERRFEAANAAWIIAGKPFKGKIYKAMTKSTREVLDLRAEHKYWYSIDLDHAERRMRLNAYL